MRRAEPNELQENALPGLVLTLSHSRRQELFPVPFEPMDPFSEPEPSDGALVQLESGLHIVVVYGTVTHRTTLFFPVSADLNIALQRVFTEIAIQPSEILWTAESAVTT